MIIIIFILFILYTLACIADGPDVKPILKTRIGNYLRNKADKLCTVRYCHPECCSFIRRSLDHISRNSFCDIEVVTCNLERIVHRIRIDERTAYYYKTGQSAINVIDEGKHLCRNAILTELSKRIKYEIDDDNPDYCIYITGSIIAEKNERRRKKQFHLESC